MSIFKRFFQIIALLFMVSFITAFTLYNKHDVLFELPLIGFSTELPLYLLASIAFFSGIILTACYYAASGARKILSSKKQVKRLERENDALKKELDAYKTEERGRQNVKKLAAV